MQEVRGAKIGMVLQDPMTALNPVFDIEDQVGEPLQVHQDMSGQDLKTQVIEMLRRVRIPPRTSGCGIIRTSSAAV